MAGDLLVLPGGEHKHRTTGFDIVDWIARGVVPSLVKANPDPPQAGACRDAHLRVVLADAAVAMLHYFGLFI